MPLDSARFSALEIALSHISDIDARIDARRRLLTILEASNRAHLLVEARALLAALQTIRAQAVLRAEALRRVLAGAAPSISRA